MQINFLKYPLFASDETLNIRMTVKSALKAYIDLPGKNSEGFTALHFAAFHGNVNILKCLVKNGANIFCKNN